MKKISLACVFALVLAGCSGAPKQQDNYQDASFELCNTEVKVYSVSDDGRVRIICSDGSKFQLNNEKTLDIMRDINVDYCTGEGLGKFNETSRYYTFQCKSGALININK